jgi:hypothetical protein
MPILYSNKFLEVEENASDEFVLTSKGVNLFKVIFASLIGGAIGGAFGFVLYWSGEDLFRSHGADWRAATFLLAFGLAGTVLAFLVVREFCWGYLPKGLRLIRNERICVVRNYLVLRWSFPLDQILAVELKIGRIRGKYARARGYYSRLYIMKSGILKSLRCCSPSEVAKNFHEAQLDGDAVGSLVSKALGVPLIKRECGKWVGESGIDGN